MNQKIIQVSSPGKLILFGEHAVVYGKKALATSLDVKTTLELKALNAEYLVFKVSNTGRSFQWSYKKIYSIQSAVEPILDQHQKIYTNLNTETIQILNEFSSQQNVINSTESLSLTAFFYLLFTIFHKNVLPRVEINVGSKLPIGAGLGSSASYCVSLVTALLALKGDIVADELLNKDKELINRWAYVGEMVIHGRPSGVDNSIITFGGAIEFKSGNIKHIKEIPSLNVLIVDTKVSRSCKSLVSKVKEKQTKYPSIMDPIMEAIEAVTDRGVDCLQKLQRSNPHEDVYSSLETDLSELVETSQGLLSCLGVNHEAIEKVLRVFEGHQLKGKLTGAGGGGCVFAFLPHSFTKPSLEKVKKELKEKGFDYYESSTCTPGVQLKTYH